MLRALTGTPLAENAKFQPQNNKQAYLAYALGLLTELPEPRTIEEALLKQYCLSGGGGGDTIISGFPIEAATGAEMESALPEAEVGAIYKYTGATNDTFEQGALYIVEEAE